jgi:sugar lactone lactonase YvrE
MTTATQISDAVLEHGEGPVWFSEFGALRCVDMLAGDVIGFADGTITRNHVGTIAAILRPRATGGAVIALEDSIVVVDGDPAVDTALQHRTRLFSDPAIRLNEGGCDPSGRLLCGTMAYDETTGAGTMYRVSADFGLEVLRSGVSISNGLAFTADGDTCYYNDTPTGIVEIVDDPNGEFRRGRALADLHAESGGPDGLCIDEDGTVWVALYGGGAVLGISAHGGIIDRIALPVSNVTACTFGGDDLSTLYITTSAQGIDRADEPEAGALFSARPGPRGMLPLPFGG